MEKPEFGNGRQDHLMEDIESMVRRESESIAATREKARGLRIDNLSVEAAGRGKRPWWE